jgi:hypothetical protein
VANLAFFKGQPTDYVAAYIGGRQVRAGLGLSFWYWRHKTQIAVVPTTETVAGFVFHESTANFQSVTVQGQLTYRVATPATALSLVNFTVDPRRGSYVTNEPERLPERITNIVQMETRDEILSRPLEAVLRDSRAIAQEVFRKVTESAALQSSGLELRSVYFLAVSPTPEVAKALEAEYRETLLRQADEAISARRAAAVEEERKIKEKELATEITLETQREQLIGLQGANLERQAETEGRAAEVRAQYDAKALATQLAAYEGQDAGLVLALALRDLGANAERIGNLTITSEMLSSVLEPLARKAKA